MYNNDLDILKSISETYLEEIKAKQMAAGALAGLAAANAGHVIANAPGPGGGMKANPPKAEKVRKAPQKQKAPVQQNQQPPGWMKAELGRF